MTDHNSIDYYASRERTERTLAAAAIDPSIAAIHLDMASRYAAIVEQSARNGAGTPANDAL